MSVSPGGIVLGGTTALMAFVDGGLSAMVGAAVVGGVTYWNTRRLAGYAGELVLKHQTEAADAAIQAEPDERKREALRKEHAARLKDCRDMAERQRVGNASVAKWIGIGAFACPVAGIALVTFQQARKHLLGNYTAEEYSAETTNIDALRTEMSKEKASKIPLALA